MVLVIIAARMTVVCFVHLIEGEYCQPGESVQIKQTSAEFSSGELQPPEQQAPPSAGVKKGSQHRPVMGRVTSTLDSTVRPRQHLFSPSGLCKLLL